MSDGAVGGADATLNAAVVDTSGASVLVAGDSLREVFEPVAAASDGQIETVSYTYDAAGNRVGAVRSLPGEVVLESIAYVYDEDDRLVSSDSTLTGVTAYSYSVDGLLTGAVNADSGVVSYEWTDAQRLRAVREGGTLLMAVSYDGDGNKVFQAEAHPVEATADFMRIDTGGSVFSWLDDERLASPAGVFWYGFAQGVAQQVAGLNGGLSVAVMEDLADGYARVDVRIPVEAGLDEADVAALSDAGVTGGDVQDLVSSLEVSTLVPSTTVTAAGFEWELTHYVNDVNRSVSQVLATYGSQASSVVDYTYGVQRLGLRSVGDSFTTQWLMAGSSAGSSLVVSPVASATGWYLADGRGSVTGVVDQTGSLSGVWSYDPWGVATTVSGTTVGSGFGFAGEETVAGVGLQFLRARWLEASSGRFLSPDPVIGSAGVTGSWNSYAYAWNDPVNRVDPSGLWPDWFDTAADAIGDAVDAFVDAVGSGISWLGDNVVAPVVNWVDSTLIQPGIEAVSNGVAPVGEIVQDVIETVGDVGEDTVGEVLEAYGTTSSYVQQLVSEVGRRIFEFSCGSAEFLGNTVYDIVRRNIAPDQISSLADDVMGGPLEPLVSRVGGFEYNAAGDFYYTRQDSIQSYLGFTDFYDSLGPLAGMQLDTNVIEFNANGQEYRLQLWKGTYGFGGAYGGEIGLYVKNPDSADWLTAVESQIPGLYPTAEPDNQIRMVQEIYTGDNLQTPDFQNDTATYADQGKHFWNLAIRTEKGIERDAIHQKGELHVDDPEVRRALAQTLEGMPGVTDVVVNGAVISYTWRRKHGPKSKICDD